MLLRVSVADTVRADVALWHATEAVVIEHVTPLLPTVNRRLDGAASTTAGATAAPSIAAIKTGLSRMIPPTVVDDRAILRLVLLTGQPPPLRIPPAGEREPLKPRYAHQLLDQLYPR